MKKLFYSMLAIAAATMTFSCMKSEEEAFVKEDPAKSVVHTFTCTFAQPDTKVDIDEATGKTTWQEGDEILVYGGNGGSSDRITVKLGKDDITPDGKKATITFSGLTKYSGSSYKSSFYAVYPASAVTSTNNLYYETRISDFSEPAMSAYDDAEGHFVFKNHFGVISFRVTGDYDSYEFVGNNNEIVAYLPDYQCRYALKTDDSVDLRRTSSNGANSSASKVLPGTLVADGTTTNYICIPEDKTGDGVTFSGGFTIKFYKDDVLKATATTAKAFTLHVGTLCPLKDITDGVKPYVAPSTSDHKSEIPVNTAKDLSGAGLTAANCYVINEPGTYKFPAVKGNSEESAGNVFGVELVWETYNNAEDVAEKSVIAQYDFEDNWIYFKTPASLKPGNALIAAKDSNGKIIWSWHIWVPASAITSNTYGLFNREFMDRELGALIAPTTESITSQSVGLTYQWGRKDPFPGAGEISSTSSNATVAGTSMTVAAGTISLTESIQNPTLYGFADGNNWMSSSDNTLWQNDVKTIYDPCPFGYKVPARDKTQPMFARADGDMSSVVGWSENAEGYYFTLGSPVAVFPLAGYRDDSSPAKVCHAYDRAAIWTAYASSEKRGFHINIRVGSTHAFGETAKSRGAYVRCVKDGSVAPIPAPDVTFAVDGDFSEWASVEAIPCENGVKTLKVGSDADNVYFYLEVEKSAMTEDAAYAYANYMTMYFDNGDGSGSSTAPYWGSAKYDKHYQFWMMSSGNPKVSNWSVTNLQKKASIDGDVIKYEFGFGRGSNAVFTGKKMKVGLFINGQTVDTSSGSEVWGGSEDPIGYAPVSTADLTTVALK